MFGIDDAVLGSGLLKGLGGLGGGGSTKTTVSTSVNNSIAVSPTIANMFGDGSVTPNVSAPAIGNPSSNASTSGSEGGGPYGFLPGGYPTSPPYRTGTGTLYGPNGQPVGVVPASGGAGDMSTLLLLGAGALLLFGFGDG